MRDPRPVFLNPETADSFESADSFKSAEGSGVRGKQVCCNTLTQQYLYQLHTIDVFVRTAIKFHLTRVKK